MLCDFLNEVLLVHHRIELAVSIREARSNAADEFGRNNITLVRRATDEDIDNVRAMGGYVPAVQEAAG